VYRVGVGFYAASYVGVDFLVNATLLLAAYLFPVRLVVRWRLGARARRLLADTTARAASALGGEARASGETVRRVAGAHAAALERLCDLENGWRKHLEER
jgi:hypothetical protein